EQSLIAAHESQALSDGVKDGLVDRPDDRALGSYRPSAIDHREATERIRRVGPGQAESADQDTAQPGSYDHGDLGQAVVERERGAQPARINEVRDDRRPGNVFKCGKRGQYSCKHVQEPYRRMSYECR